MAHKTPVSVLYELCAKVGLPDPRFVNLSKNQKEFECGVEAFGYRKRSSGDSYKNAKQNVAKKLLDILERDRIDLREDIEKISGKFHNHVGVLIDKCIKLHLPRPRFVVVEQNLNRITINCIVGDYKVYATDFSAKHAKDASAKAMLDRLANNQLEQQVIPLFKGPQRIFLNVDGDRYNSARKLLENVPESANKQKLLKDICEMLDIPVKSYKIDTKDGTQDIIEITCKITYIQKGDKAKICSEILNYLQELLLKDD
uniref:Uncharacterized protein n=1 Tax=Phlebotomus papatasi TaxID=29031 RepID=A0A1B0EVB8_PHLPP